MQNFILFVHDHILISSALVMVFGLLIAIEWIKQKRSTEQLTPAVATQRLNREDAVVVDIRSTDLFTQGHIINAISLPVVNSDSIKKLNAFKTQLLIIADSTGAESSKAAEIILRAGFKITTLAGGMRAWKEAGMPIVKH